MAQDGRYGKGKDTR